MSDHTTRNQYLKELARRVQWLASKLDPRDPKHGPNCGMAREARATVWALEQITTGDKETITDVAVARDKWRQLSAAWSAAKQAS